MLCRSSQLRGATRSPACVSLFVGSHQWKSNTERDPACSGEVPASSPLAVRRVGSRVDPGLIAGSTRGGRYALAGTVPALAR